MSRTEFHCEQCKKVVVSDRAVLGNPTFFCSMKHYKQWKDEHFKKDSNVIIRKQENSTQFITRRRL